MQISGQLDLLTWDRELHELPKNNGSSNEVHQNQSSRQKKQAELVSFVWTVCGSRRGRLDKIKPLKDKNKLTPPALHLTCIFCFPNYQNLKNKNRIN